MVLFDVEEPDRYTFVFEQQEFMAPRLNNHLTFEVVGLLLLLHIFSLDSGQALFVFIGKRDPFNRLNHGITIGN